MADERGSGSEVLQGAVMYSVNPLSGALAQSSELQKLQSNEKARQARQAQEQKKNIAARGEDEFESENQIENTEELTPVHDENRQSNQRRKQNKHPGEEEESAADDLPDSLDLTA
ncbi:MAG: hypothetical protein ABSH22_07680 [Tepidisphaeraceae bacterium]|jgi:hypothetical protein